MSNNWDESKNAKRYLEVYENFLGCIECIYSKNAFRVMMNNIMIVVDCSEPLDIDRLVIRILIHLVPDSKSAFSVNSTPDVYVLLCLSNLVDTHPPGWPIALFG